MKKKTHTAAIMLVRLSTLLALLTGLAFWAGIGALPVHLHMTLGIVLVLCAWWLAGLGSRAQPGRAAVLALLALLVPVVGIMQLAGPLFGNLGLTRVVHVVLALLTTGVAEMLNKRLRA